MKLFQIAVIKHPTDKEKEAGEKSMIVVDIKTVLAKDLNAANLIAGRSIPEEHMKHLDQLEVAARPF